MRALVIERTITKSSACTLTAEFSLPITYCLLLSTPLSTLSTLSTLFTLFTLSSLISPLSSLISILITHNVMGYPSIWW